MAEAGDGEQLGHALDERDHHCLQVSHASSFVRIGRSGWHTVRRALRACTSQKFYRHVDATWLRATTHGYAAKTRALSRLRAKTPAAATGSNTTPWAASARRTLSGPLTAL